MIDIPGCSERTNFKEKLICNSPNDIISGNFNSEKVDQDGIFYYKDILHFFFFYTFQKSYLRLVYTLKVSVITVGVLHSFGKF
jgi:hypothetical protein